MIKLSWAQDAFFFTEKVFSHCICQAPPLSCSLGSSARTAHTQWKCSDWQLSGFRVNSDCVQQVCPVLCGTNRWWRLRWHSLWRSNVRRMLLFIPKMLSPGDTASAGISWGSPHEEMRLRIKFGWELEVNYAPGAIIMFHIADHIMPSETWVSKLGLSTNILNSNICFRIFKKNGDSIVKINIRLWKKPHQRLLCKWAHSMTGQGQVTGVGLAQRHSLLKVRRNKNCRCRWQREKT